MRLFLAFELPSYFKNEVLATLESGKNIFMNNIKWVNNNNLHITLYFMGDIKSNDLELFIDEFRIAFSDFKAFELSSPKIEFVPANKPRLVWISLKEVNPNLRKYIKRIKQIMVDFGYKIEPKKFKSHITLGRFRQNATYNMEHFSRFESKMFQHKKIKINELKLFESTLTPDGPIYSEIATFNLI